MIQSDLMQVHAPAKGTLYAISDRGLCIRTYESRGKCKAFLGKKQVEVVTQVSV